MLKVQNVCDVPRPSVRSLDGSVGIDTLVREETNLPVTIADEPNKVVVIGAGKILDDLNRFEKVIYTMKRA